MEKNVTHTVRLSVSDYEEASRIAKEEERSLSNLLSLWIRRVLRERHFQDDDTVVMHHEVPR